MAAKQAAEKKPIGLQHPAELNERSRKIVEILQGQRRDRQIEDFWRERQIFFGARETDKRNRASQSRQRRHSDERGGFRESTSHAASWATAYPHRGRYGTRV